MNPWDHVNNREDFKFACSYAHVEKARRNVARHRLNIFATMTLGVIIGFVVYLQFFCERKP